MQKVKRIYVEKRPLYATQAKAVLSKIRDYLEISSVKAVRVFIRYDMQEVSEELYKKAVNTVFSEPPLDDVYEDKLPEGMDSVFSIEYLPGQFDQRADSAMQALSLLAPNQAIIKCATTYGIVGSVTESQLALIKGLVLNPVDSRETTEELPDTLTEEYDSPGDVEILEGFRDRDEASLRELYDSLSLAMTFKDMLHIQKYFIEEEKRDPSITEIRVFDTYWSDHCRHTTFSTHLNNIVIEDGQTGNHIKETFDSYKKDFDEIYKGRDDKYVCLMDIATLAAKKIAKEGLLSDKEVSDEINACSIVIPVDVDGKTEEWLLNFKNETHNHPTEIEPFGGAATCLGGAIRDPLSGRTYCYQAMRVTGAADPTKSLSDTLPGKLSQQRIVTEAAQGYSSYGNQIGLATGLVREVYHPGFEAKRMEIGAVMAAAPVAAVKRLEPTKGDVIILLGGRTGRDGIGGATGSSKAHDKSSTMECGAEVQKGNAPTERKLQRLFRRRDASLLIKRCNDFGAGGVSVAIGELAEGLDIDLDKVPKKYAGLDGTELSISESQERMAVVVDPGDVDKFLELAAQENLEAVPVATVTDRGRLTIKWRGKNIVDIKRSFLDTNGARQETNVLVKDKGPLTFFDAPINEAVKSGVDAGDFMAAAKATLTDLNVSSQRGLTEMFDSSIGAGSVLYPYGGKYQQTPIQTMIAKIPVPLGSTRTASMMSYGYDPYLSSESTYHGAAYAVLASISKIVASGGDYKTIRFTFQEYFKKMGDDAANWGLPFAALLGAYHMQRAFMLPAIGGKDSMSGSFEDIHVPPTLCSFAVNTINVNDVISPELKKAGSRLYLYRIPKDSCGMPDTEAVKGIYDNIRSLMSKGRIISAYCLDAYGIFPAVFHTAVGNRLGVDFDDKLSLKELFVPEIGSIMLEVDGTESLDGAVCIGTVTDNQSFTYKGSSLAVSEGVDIWENKLSRVFPIRHEAEIFDSAYKLAEGAPMVAASKVARPRVFIPVFPGTNCEYDLSYAFERAGAEVDICVFKNRDAADIEESMKEFERLIKGSQIIMFPGGFSAGDEPEGSAKFFAAAFRNDRLRSAIDELLNHRDGLILGICNGFQALIKLGLVPFGDIRPQEENVPTLTYNSIGRHISRIAYTKVVSHKSPWLSKTGLGDTYAIPISHGEGRFVANKEWIDKLYANGQVATRYVSVDGEDLTDADSNPNGSYGAIEGILSPDGRVFGKMGHSERIGKGVGINIAGEQDMKIFEAGVDYYR